MTELLLREGTEGDQEAAADALLDCAGNLIERPSVVRAQTWQRLRRNALGLEGSVETSRSPWVWVALSLLALALVIVAAAPLFLRSLRSATAALRQVAQDTSGTSALTGSSGTARITSATPSSGAVSADGWREIDLGEAGRLFAAPGASFQLPDSNSTSSSDYVVTLEHGEICVQVAHREPRTQGAFVVRTFELSATALGTRFCVFGSTGPDGSWVAVEEGRVRVDRPGHDSVVAAAGETVRTRQGPDPTSASTRLPSPSSATRVHPMATTSRCLASSSVGEQESCLWHQAGGSDLAAQNALYLLGAMAQGQQHDGRAALSIWDTYRHRFPRGVLAPETTWAMFNELVAQHRYEEALSVSESFLQSSRGYSGWGELELKRGDLLANTLERTAAAERTYQLALDAETSPPLREEALFKLGLCQERQAETARARATWDAYAHEFPQGPHAQAVTRRLEALRPDLR